METQAATPKKRSFTPFIILGIIAIVGSIYGYRTYNYNQTYETTDNAQIDGNINPVLPRMAGYITELHAKENQKVKAGDLLAKLDDRELEVKVKQAEAALQNAIANVKVVQANAKASSANANSVGSNIGTVTENIQAAQVRLDKAQLEYDRYAQLVAEKSASQSLFDNADAEKKASAAQINVVRKQLESARKQLEAAQSQATAAEQQIAVAQVAVTQKKVELELAKLQLSYAAVTAQASGKISRKSVQVGQFVQTGQSLMTIVSDDDVWVTANFKETQLEKMREGQPVIIHVDSYPDVKFEGVVESMAGATGSKFALLPADNASGNFVKVVQRVPVKVVFSKQPSAEHPLRAGMNVKLEVKIK
jgi:membrane fusion protein (multidrug efflux system)